MVVRKKKFNIEKLLAEISRIAYLVYLETKELLTIFCILQRRRREGSYIKSKNKAGKRKAKQSRRGVGR